jgi:hypothetical protein
MATPPGRRNPPRPPALQPRPPRPQRPPADPALQQRAWAAALLALLGIFAIVATGGNLRRGVFVMAVGVIVALTALWLAISAMSRARRAGSGRPRGAVFATVAGAIGAVFGGMALIGFLTFWPQLSQYSQCQSAAITVSAQQACSQQLQNSVGNEISVLRR